MHFPTLSKLAERNFGLLLIAKRRFGNYFSQFAESGRDLLNRMSALETYPAHEQAAGSDNPDSYGHARQYLESLKQQQQHSNNGKVGTLSREEWEAATLYVIFAFKKMSDS